MIPIMPSRSTTLLHGLAPAVALALATAIAVPALAMAPRGDFEQLIAEADAHTSEGRHAEALESYADAFAAMPIDLKVSGVGEFVAVAAARAALEDYAARGEIESLERARMVLLAFVGAVQTADPALGPATVDSAKERLAEINAAMPAVTEAPLEPPPAPGAAQEPTPDPITDTPSPRSRAGLGLIVSGGVVALAGVGLATAGLRQVPWYEGKLADEGWMTSDEGYDQQIAEAERVRNIDLGLGIGALVAGVGLGVTGAVLMTRSKRSHLHEVALMPVLARDRAILGATMRF